MLFCQVKILDTLSDAHIRVFRRFSFYMDILSKKCFSSLCEALTRSDNAEKQKKRESRFETLSHVLITLYYFRRIVFFNGI